MIHFRSIRRKLFTGFTLGFLMLLVLCGGSVWALASYYSVLKHFRFNIRDLPHKQELALALYGMSSALEDVPLTRDHTATEHLFEADLRARSHDRESARQWLAPVRAEIEQLEETYVRGDSRLSLARADDRQRAQEYQLQLLTERLETSQAALDEFVRRFEKLPAGTIPAGQRPVTSMLLDSIRSNLAKVEKRKPGLVGPDAAAARAEIDELVARSRDPLSTIVSVEGVTVRELDGDLRQFKFLSWIVLISTVAAFVLFFTTVRLGVRWLFYPIRVLHQGARRVAQGDFDYRLQISSRDEMSELANSFNQMTDRFQETERYLEQQVQERSRQLVRSERLAGVGFLAAGVAHEINNPLSAVVMAADSINGRLSELLPDGDSEELETVRGYLKMIQAESFRCRGITQKLLDFSRGESAACTANDLTNIVSEVVAMVGHLSKFRDRAVRFDQADRIVIEVNGPEIKQVFLNLVANGLESMESGGTLEIRIVEEIDFVTVEFQDDGCGMTPEVIQNLFEPFFTQRREGKGTGLGLSISDRIVNEHNGTIEASSAGPGQGSLFRVRLPRKSLAQNAA